jgi:hypothetical protein
MIPIVLLPLSILAAAPCYSRAFVALAPLEYLIIINPLLLDLGFGLSLGKCTSVYCDILIHLYLLQPSLATLSSSVRPINVLFAIYTSRLTSWPYQLSYPITIIMSHRAEHDLGAPESSSPRSPTRTMQSIRTHPYKRASLAISEAWSAEHPHVQDLYIRDAAEHLVRRTKRRHQHNAMDL